MILQIEYIYVKTKPEGRFIIVINNNIRYFIAINGIDIVHGDPFSKII